MWFIYILILLIIDRRIETVPLHRIGIFEPYELCAFLLNNNHSTSQVSIELVKSKYGNTDTLQKYTNELEALNAQNLSAIIHTYDHALGTLASQLEIPYFVVSNPTLGVRAPSMFEMNISPLDLGQLTASLIQVQAVQSVSIVLDSDPYAEYLLQHLGGLPLRFAHITSNMTDTQLQTVLQGAIQEIPRHCYVIALSDGNQNMIPRILEQALNMGQLRFGKLWIMHTLTVQPELINRYLKSRARIINYQLVSPSTFRNGTQMVKALISDALNHFVRSVRSSTDQLVQRVATGRSFGRSGAVIFNSKHERVDEIITISATSSDSGGTLEKVGRFISQGSNSKVVLFNQLISNTVRVAVLGYNPFVTNTKNGMFGYSVDLVNKLKTQIRNFNHTFVYAEDNKYGFLSENGSWNGLIQLLIENKADFAAVPLTTNPDRMKVVDFSGSVYSSGITILMKNPGNEDIDFIWLLQPFTYNVWLCIIIAYLLFGLIFWILNIIAPNPQSNSQHHETQHAQYSLLKSIFIAFSSLVMAKLSIKPRSFSGRVFSIILWFSTLLLVATYASNMVAFLAKSKQTLPFISFEQLENNTNGYYWGFLNGSTTASRFENLGSQSTYGRIYLKAKQQWPEKMFIANEEEVLTRLNWDRKFVFIGDVTLIERITHHHCSMKSIVDAVLMDSNNIPVRREWFAKNILINAIDTLKKNGELDKLQAIWFRSGPCVGSSSEIAEPIPLNLMAGLFVALVCGILLAILVALLDYIITNTQYMCVLRKLPKLKFGEDFEARITGVEPDGAWVKLNARPKKYFIPNGSLHSDPLKIYDAKDLDLHAGDKINVKYFGKDPISQAKRFTVQGKIEEKDKERHEDKEEEHDNEEGGSKTSETGKEGEGLVKH